jgi:hypothetical protein
LRIKKDLSNPDLPYAALEVSACAAFIKERRLKCAEVTSCTGDPGNRSHDRSHEGCGARLAAFSADITGLLEVEGWRVHRFQNKIVIPRGCNFIDFSCEVTGF